MASNSQTYSIVILCLQFIAALLYLWCQISIGLSSAIPFISALIIIPVVLLMGALHVLKDIYRKPDYLSLKGVIALFTLVLGIWCVY